MAELSYIADFIRKLAFARPARRSSAQPSRSPWRWESRAPPTSATATSPQGATSKRPTTPTSKPIPTIISPKASGYLAEVLVGDNRAGQGRPIAGADR